MNEIFSALSAEHFGGEEVDFIGRSRRRFLGFAAFGAATPEAALLASERADAVVAGVREAASDEGEDEDVLEVEGHQGL